MGANESREGSGNNEENGGDLRNDKADLSTGALAAGAVAGAALLAYGLSRLVSGSGSESEPKQKGKTMKAPGRGGEQILRNDFARDPKAYFKDLHRK
ncbi:unnamed protein product [Prunus brigantina]